MRLVIETATTACSVALLADGGVADARHEIVGRGHAERLVPMIGAMLGARRADDILVDCGPGSFTGVRVGLAAAKGLAIGWGVPAAGCSSLALVAAAAFAEDGGADTLCVAIGGGHGELFVQRFARSPFTALDDLRSLTPAAAAAAIASEHVVGNGAAALVAARGWGNARDRAPDARDAILLPAAFVTLPPSPIYGRAPDARPAVAAGQAA